MRTAQPTGRNGHPLADGTTRVRGECQVRDATDLAPEVRRTRRLAPAWFALFVAVATPGATAAEYVEIVKLAPEDLRATDFFGKHLALSGNRLAVASEDWNGGTGAGYPISKGAVYVFEPIALPTIAVSGGCAGEVTFTVSGATPGGAVAIAAAAGEGLTDPPGELCLAIELGLEQPQLMRRLLSTPTVGRSALARWGSSRSL